MPEPRAPALSEIQEPAKDFVLGFQPGSNIPRSATVCFRQNKRSFKTIVNLSNSTFTPPVEIPKSKGELGLTIQEIIDFSFVSQNQDFINALARRGIDTAHELAKVLVTPLRRVRSAGRSSTYRQGADVQH